MSTYLEEFIFISLLDLKIKLDKNTNEIRKNNYWKSCA